ncbi:MAG: hypothetical protein Q4C49_10675 [Bacillota bacterium]|nr:hypothetical protein [Bacillota bacterium]
MDLKCPCVGMREDLICDTDCADYAYSTQKNERTPYIWYAANEKDIPLIV